MVTFIQSASLTHQVLNEVNSPQAAQVGIHFKSFTTQIDFHWKTLIRTEGKESQHKKHHWVGLSVLESLQINSIRWTPGSCFFASEKANKLFKRLIQFLQNFDPILETNTKGKSFQTFQFLGFLKLTFCPIVFGSDNK